MTKSKLALLIAEKEGLKKSVDIAQIKEILRVLGEILRDDEDSFHTIHCLTKK